MLTEKCIITEFKGDPHDPTHCSIVSRLQVAALFLSLGIILRRGLLALAILAILAPSAFASYVNLYIGSANAGSADGSSCANAKIYTFFNSSSNWGAGATQIGSDSTVHICGTITTSSNTNALTFQGSGMSGHPVTLLWETDAILESPYFPLTTGAVDASSRSYLTINGGSNGIIRNTANGGARANQQSTLQMNANACASCVVENIHFNDAYVWSGGSDTMNSTNVRAILPPSSNSTLHNNSFDNCGWCVYYGWVNGDDSIEWYANYFVHYGHAMAAFATGASTNLTNFKVYGNELDGPGTAWDDVTCINHKDGIHVFGGGSGTYSVDNFYFYNNYAHGNWGTCPTGWVFVEAGGTDAHLKNGYFWNNVGIVDPSAAANTTGWFTVASGISGVQKILNNTFIGANNTDNTLCLNLAILAGVTAQNNTISNCGDPIQINSSTVVSVNNNFYGTSCGNGGNCFIWNGSFTGSFAAWKTACSCDGASHQNSSPLLNSDGSPKASSPVIQAGTDLTSTATGALASLSSDTTLGGARVAVARPSGTAWDDGAYQYNTDTTPPVPGNSGTIATASVASTTLTLNWTAATDAVTPQASLQYEVCQSLSNNVTTIAQCEAATVMQSFTANIITLPVTSIACGTTHYFNVVVRDATLNKAAYTPVSQATSSCGGQAGAGKLRLK